MAAVDGTMCRIPELLNPCKASNRPEYRETSAQPVRRGGQGTGAAASIMVVEDSEASVAVQSDLVGLAEAAGIVEAVVLAEEALTAVDLAEAEEAGAVVVLVVSMAVGSEGRENMLNYFH